MWFSCVSLGSLAEARSDLVEDACMCEAQIVFQKKVHHSIKEINGKHILSHHWYECVYLRVHFTIPAVKAYKIYNKITGSLIRKNSK